MSLEQIESLLEWCDYTFDTSSQVRNNWVYIRSQTASIFSVNLDDYKRFGKYSFFHKPLGREGSHLQIKTSSLIYGLWICCGHDFYKYDKELTWTKEDFNRWQSDFYFLLRSGLI
jgi:hypothetical protein